ncbi:Asp/Glu racemase [Nocardia sp. CA2R105]|uniref:maleate cis-trans isomerase family protein n=1 Tax=Nocardia coffeae TaxID=2873381 RepID=UPI001CA6DE37|nr:Asp/Glu racemase [Nocardia coffeae]MBY8863424.1 Asp/Glu racemase [Nocardia coffeae]
MFSHRIGLLVPSSNTTMETELPIILHRVSRRTGHSFTLHSSRMRMTTVTSEELAATDDEVERAAFELSDAEVDVIAYAFLIAIMSQGPGVHRGIERRLAEVAEYHQAGGVVSSAGALIAGLHHLGAKKTAIVTPYPKPLTAKVAGYIEAEGIEVQDAISLEVDDNLAVGKLDPAGLKGVAMSLDIRDVDVVVLSACVQMPSLHVIPEVQAALGVPVITAATATAWQMLERLGRPAVAADTGALFLAP